MKVSHAKGYQAFYNALIDARKEAGLTQLELAVRLNKPQSFVSKIEAGERRLDVVEFVVVMKAIGSSSSEVLHAVELSLLG